VHALSPAVPQRERKRVGEVFGCRGHETFGVGHEPRLGRVLNCPEGH
jgi:hypothetical protein